MNKNNKFRKITTVVLLKLLFCLLPMVTYGAELKHPGMLSTKTDLDFVKQQVKNKKEPWFSAYNDLKAEKPEERIPNFKARIIGLNNHKEMDKMTRDGSSAYACALLWYISGETKYSRNAVKLLNAWIGFKQHDNNLFLSWAAPQFLNAAEIMKHTPGSGWAVSDSRKFTDMVRTLWLPEMRKGNTPNNSKHSAIEAHMACAIFIDSKSELDKAIGQWKKWTPAYLYIESDGEPISVTRKETWKAKPIYHGQSSETCRDLNHTRLGTYSLFFSAEMAWNQGTDLWKLEWERLSAFSELHAGWLSGDVEVPSNICGGRGVFCAGADANSTNRRRPPSCGGALWELSLNHIQNRLGKPLPRTDKLTKRTRPDIDISHRNRKFQTLTHANLPMGNTPIENNRPVVTFAEPKVENGRVTLNEGYSLFVQANIVDEKISTTELFINNELIRAEKIAPYEWGDFPNNSKPTELNGLPVGEYTIKVVATDDKGLKGEKSFTFIVTKTQINNDAPTITLTSPVDGEIVELGQEIILKATASDPNGNLEKVNFFVDDVIHKSVTTRPFSSSFIPERAGTYKITARAIDSENARKDDVAIITVVEKNEAPVASFSTPTASSFMEGYSSLVVTVDASDPNGDSFTVLLKINGEDVRKESVAPYEWGHAGSPTPEETQGLSVGDHVFEAVITDAKGASTTIEKIIRVDRITSTSSLEGKNEWTVYPNPSESGLFKLSHSLDFEVHSVDGETILENSGQNVDLSSYPNGIYFLKVDQKIIKLVR